MKSIGQLDEEHPEIFGHCDHHLPDRCRLGMLPTAVLQSVELGDSVDEICDLLAELGNDLLQGHHRVLDRVVEQRRRQGGFVHAVVGQDQRHRHGVGYVGLAGLPRLTLVGPRRQRVCPVEEVGGNLWMACMEGSENLPVALVGVDDVEISRR